MRTLSDNDQIRMVASIVRLEESLRTHGETLADIKADLADVRDELKEVLNKFTEVRQTVASQFHEHELRHKNHEVRIEQIGNGVTLITEFAEEHRKWKHMAMGVALFLTTLGSGIGAGFMVLVDYFRGKGHGI